MSVGFWRSRSGLWWASTKLLASLVAFLSRGSRPFCGLLDGGEDSLNALVSDAVVMKGTKDVHGLAFPSNASLVDERRKEEKPEPIESEAKQPPFPEEDRISNRSKPSSAAEESL